MYCDSIQSPPILSGTPLSFPSELSIFPTWSPNGNSTSNNDTLSPATINSHQVLRKKWGLMDTSSIYSGRSQSGEGIHWPWCGPSYQLRALIVLAVCSVVGGKHHSGLVLSYAMMRRAKGAVSVILYDECKL